MMMRAVMEQAAASHPSILMVEPLAQGHTVKNYSALFDSEAWADWIRRGGGDLRIVCPQMLRARLQQRASPRSVPEVFLTGHGPDSPKWGRLDALIALLRAARTGAFDRIYLMYLDDLLFLVPLIRLCVPRVHLSGLYTRPMAHFAAMG